MLMVLKRYNTGEYKNITSNESTLKIININKKTHRKNKLNNDINKSDVMKK